MFMSALLTIQKMSICRVFADPVTFILATLYSMSVHTVNQPHVHMCQDYSMHWLLYARHKLSQVWIVLPLKNPSQ